MGTGSRAGGTVRISFSSLLRVGHDDRYVLFHSPNRPGSYGPPGGVFKYFEPAMPLLEGMGFHADRIAARADTMVNDLRGFVPARSLKRLLDWFRSGAYREDAVECLHRELEEELEETGLPRLVDGVRGLSFAPVRTIMAGPYDLPGKSYRQLRRFEVYDLVPADHAGARLRAELLGAGADPAIGTVLSASAADIGHGRCGSALIGGHSAYLIGPDRIFPDLPSMR